MTSQRAQGVEDGVEAITHGLKDWSLEELGTVRSKFDDKFVKSKQKSILKMLLQPKNVPSQFQAPK
jgi:hypothetical protein